MSFTTSTVSITLALFAGMLALLEVGRRLGLRRFEQDGDGGRAGVAAVEGSVFGLMGLLIAFTFSGASSRFEARRALIVEEANAIGTAWLRLDLAPESAQPAMRDQFRHYLHMIGFAAVTAVAIYVILDLEYPRRGFIRVDAADQVLIDLRASMD